MHKEDIKAALRKRFGSLLEFERAYGLARESASMMLRGKVSRRTADAIANAIGVEVHDIWPDKYPRPRRRGVSAETIPNSGKTHRLNDGAR